MLRHRSTLVCGRMRWEAPVVVYTRITGHESPPMMTASHVSLFAARSHQQNPNLYPQPYLALAPPQTVGQTDTLVPASSSQPGHDFPRSCLGLIRAKCYTRATSPRTAKEWLSRWMCLIMSSGTLYVKFTVLSP